MKPGRTFRAALTTLGAVATVAGARGVLVGAAEVPDGGRVSANVDSEYRFYAAWYHLLGLVLLRTSRSANVDRSVVDFCAGGFALAAVGRLLSLRTLGRPHRTQLLLLALEIVTAAILPMWHRRSSVPPVTAT